MRWLQWSTIDLEQGLGGVEVHARSLARELRKLGIEAEFSRNAADLASDRWDVIHTHGSAIPLIAGKARALRLHTLHGTTLGRMSACREWTWPGGYFAAAREASGVMAADIVLSVHPKLSLFSFAKKLGKSTAVCWNGWDAGGCESTRKDELSSRFRELLPSWVFIGRGQDYVKGADRLSATVPLLPDLRFVAVPGSGFEGDARVKRTGPLSNDEVSCLLQLSRGLVLPSRYEGNSLVVLEALGNGVPVVATKVGGVPVLPAGLQGLIPCESGDPRAIADAIRAADRLAHDEDARLARAEANRKLLPTWGDVAKIALEAVQAEKSRRGQG